MHHLADVIRRDGEARFWKKHAHITPFAIGLQVPAIADRARRRGEDALRQLNRAASQQLDDVIATKHAATRSPAFTLPGPDAPPGASDLEHLISNYFDPIIEKATWYEQQKKPSPPAQPPTFGAQLRSAVGGGAPGAFGHALMAPVDAVGRLLASPLSGVSSAVEETIKKRLVPQEFGQKQDPLHIAGSALAKSFGSAVGTLGVDLLKDMASKAMAAAGSIGDQAARNAILQQLKRNDPVLSEADDKVLMESFHTMARFAPTLSTDKNAVRSFLRQAVMGGGGPDYTTIKLLAESERAVTGDRGK